MIKRTFTSTLIATAFIACLGTGSCKKDDADNPDLIIGKWKMTGYIHNGADVYGTAVPPCVTDDIITFGNTNIITLDEGLTKCNPTDPQTSTGTYLLNNNKTQVTITYNGSTDIDSILTLNSTTLTLKQFSNNDVITHTRQP